MINVEKIAHKLRGIWRKVYVVGSYNVHALLKRNFWSDIDLATDARPEEIRSVLRVVWEIWAKFWTLIVREWSWIYEITTFRKDYWSIKKRKPENVVFTDSLNEDAQRRDFTFNAIYYDPLEDRYYDPVWGIGDLKDSKIRFVWDASERLQDDMLRLLRYIRLKNKYSMNPALPEYEDIVSKYMPFLREISVERIKQELDKMISDKTNVDCLSDLKRYWFFSEFIPHLNNLSEAPGWKKIHLEWNVWKHTLRVMHELSKQNIKDIDIFWAALLHDIWKYVSFGYDENWGIHYFWHEITWAKIFEEYISNAFKFPKKSKAKISWLISNHIRIWTLAQMKPLKRNQFMAHPYFKDLIYLCIADNLWKIPSNESSMYLLDKYEMFLQKYKRTIFLTGEDIRELYPDLKWKEIWQRLKQENEKILSEI